MRSGKVVHERLDAARRIYLRANDGRLWGRPLHGRKPSIDGDVDSDAHKRRLETGIETGYRRTATAHGGEAVTLVQAIKERERQREALARDLLTLERPRPVSADGARLRGELRVKLADWRAMLRAHVPQARRGPPALRASWVPSFPV